MTSDSATNDPTAPEEQVQWLAHPVRIAESTWPSNVTPLVSICCLTYNHEKFIRECLDGFLMQETTFPVEILIHDDASTDSTANVIREYEAQYPHLIKPISQRENQYSQGIRPFMTFVLPVAKGKYIAICEGDDYWTSPLKLQKQVDLLGKRPDAALCLHNSIIHFETGESETKVAITRVKQELELYDFIDLDYFHESGGLTSRGHTSSLLFRNNLLSKLPAWYAKAASGDLYLHMFLASKGKGLFIDENMSVYRVNSGGITRSIPAHRGHELASNRIKMLSCVNKHFDMQFDDLIKTQLAGFHKREFLAYINESNYLNAIRHGINTLRYEREGRIDLLKSAYWFVLRRVKSSPTVSLVKRYRQYVFGRVGFSYDPLRFVDGLFQEKESAYASVPNGPITLYGTCYGLLTQRYLGRNLMPSAQTIDFILSCQDPDTGLFEGPELVNAELPGTVHNEEHLLHHLTCTALPILQQWNVSPRYPIYSAHRFTEPEYLTKWLNERDLHNAWLEGNNLLFIGQLLVYLRDHERHKDVANALNIWFDWLDSNIDPDTGLWGTNGFCSNYNAMYGGYHQLLVYYYEHRPVRYREALIDTVLSLQHHDGGFSQSPGGGACEDVDAVDILVNMYKQIDYKRPKITRALKRNLDLILSIQNDDGGFPYNQNMQSQSHMGIPATVAGKGVSTMFATWFRVHTVALIAEVLPEIRAANKLDFEFSNYLSMGWHRKNH